MDRLKELPSESVHCVVTSPPYWGLRDYGTAKWEGGDLPCSHEPPAEWYEQNFNQSAGDRIGKQTQAAAARSRWYKDDGACQCGARRIDFQIGMESTPELYTEKMVAVAREIKRVLRRDGSFWLNLGDSYGGSGKGPDDKQPGVRDYTSPPYVGNGVKAKDLVGIPWMIAFALRADGWYLRSDIIWAKPNPMPESVTDRPTKSHEYIFLLTKSSRYFFDAEAVKETATSTDDSIRDRDNTKLNNTPGRTRMGGLVSNGYQKRNIRSVWRIATEPYNEAHFATFPKRLVERCVKASTSEHGVCAECGAPYVRDVTVEPMEIDRSKRTHELGRTRSSGTMTKPRYSQTVGWKSTCSHDTHIVPAVVLDPFSGSGTTGVVANNLGRDYIGIELNPEYVAMSERRLFNPQPSFMDALRDEYDLQNQQGLTE